MDFYVYYFVCLWTLQISSSIETIFSISPKIKKSQQQPSVSYVSLWLWECNVHSQTHTTECFIYIYSLLMTKINY